MVDLEETQLGNHKSFQVRFCALRRAMLLDSINQGTPFSLNDLQTISDRISSEGASFTQVTLPYLGRALDQGLVSGTFNCPTSFRLAGITRLPRFLYPCFSEIFEDDGRLKVNASLTTIRNLRLFLLFDSKRECAMPQKINESFISEFSAGQLTLRKVRIQTDHPVIEIATKLISIVMSRFPLQAFTPGHGPGATAEGFERDEKWDFTSWPAKAEKWFPYLLYGTANMRLSCQSKPIPLISPMVTKGCLVPKDFRGPRLISIEPTAMQYLQQGVLKRLMHHFENEPLLWRSIRLRDQTFNRIKASSSIRDNMATVDLSSASDTLSATLVWHLFSGVPALRRLLFSLRSDYVRFPGHDPIRLVAFAPMGSAICFPIETLVFWSLAVASMKLTRGSESFRSCASEVSVFGDDIVIPNDSALQTLIGTLQSIGCRPNMSKTCYSTPFRESCGGEWYGDNDVTIIRNKHFHYSALKKLSQYPVLLNLQRKFFLRGFSNTAECLIDWAREIYPVMTINPSLLRHLHGEAVDVPNFAYSDTTSVEDVPVRWNKDYQRFEARTPVSIQKTRDWSITNESRLLARLVFDSTERIALRDSNIRKAWRSIDCLGLITPNKL
jgi:hypothetical protein